MKKCSKCNQTKSNSNYYKHSYRSDNLSSTCKECSKIINLNYHRSKKGLITSIYSHQLADSRKRRHSPPCYTLEELREWINKQSKFNILFDNWKNSNYNKSLTPSIDRLNDYEPYCFDNIQLVTWGENFNKHHKDRKEGRNNKHNLSVISIDLSTGEEIKYYSIREASRITGVNQSDISKACKGIYKQAKGYIWKYI